jgi:hypothetical protein
MLARQFPALAAALTKLGEEHAMWRGYRKRSSSSLTATSPARATPPASGTTSNAWLSDLEAHFAYEEKTIVTALNAIAAAPAVG